MSETNDIPSGMSIITTPGNNKLSIPKAPPKPGEPLEKKVNGRRLLWDAEDGKWRMAGKHLNENVNPFDGTYVPVKPINPVPDKKFYSDANGVRLKLQDGEYTVSKVCYPSSIEGFFSGMWDQKGVKPKAFNTKTRSEKVLKFLAEGVSGIPEMEKYLDKNGQPKSEMIVGFYIELWKLIHSRPEIVLAFARAAYNEALHDPLKSVEKFQKTTGLPMSLVVGQDAGTGQQFVKLNIFDQGDGADDEQDIQQQIQDQING